MKRENERRAKKTPDKKEKEIARVVTPHIPKGFAYFPQKEISEGRESFLLNLVDKTVLIHSIRF